MASQNQDKLRAHFQALPDASHGSGWDALWADASFLPWDRGNTNPALIDLLTSQAAHRPPPVSPNPNPSRGAPGAAVLGGLQIPGPIKPDGSRARVLIPGCGKGYDVALFAAHGYNASGLEISEHAVQAAFAYLADVGQGPLEGEYAVANAARGIDRGKMACFLGDFFTEEWRQVDTDNEYDIIYDITFLCALPPTLRSAWAARMRDLLAPTGSLICLEFPTHKPPSSGGPPWALPPALHAELLKQPGAEILYDAAGNVVETDRPNAPGALVRVAHYTPQRTHDAGIIGGVVRDCVSVWRHA